MSTSFKLNQNTGIRMKISMMLPQHNGVEETNNSSQKSGQGKTAKETSCPYDKPEIFMKKFSLSGGRSDDPSHILDEKFRISKKRSFWTKVF